MALFTITVLTPEEAVARGHDAFDVILSNWAGSALDTYPVVNSGARQASFPFTPQAVIIGPESTVDRCWFSWNSQKPNIASFIPENLTRQLSVDSPLFFSQPANKGIITTGGAPSVKGMTANLLYAYPTLPINAIPYINNPAGIPSTVIPATYLKADGAVTNFFADYQLPVLHLRFFLKGGLSMPPAKRAPQFTQLPVNGGFVFGAGVEVQFAAIPVYGRKNIILQMRATTAAATFRVAALRGTNPTTALQETTEGLKTTVLANESVRFHLCDPAADWLFLYVNPSVDATDCGFTLAAYD